jgi:hypothetical protein
MDFFPVYFFDKQEQFFPIDYNDFIRGEFTEGIINYHIHTVGTITLIYFLAFYLYDTGLYSQNWDSHFLDFEYVVYKYENQELDSVCFCPHAFDSHFCLSNEDTQTLLKIGTNHINVYPSRGKHASYPIYGIIWRYIGFANDINFPMTEHKNLRFVPLNNQSLYSFHISSSLQRMNLKDIPIIPLNMIRYYKYLPTHKKIMESIHMLKNYFKI